MFQCSSASRKFLNQTRRRGTEPPQRFQCSSASRKFLNFAARCRSERTVSSFSALQRAENSSTRGRCPQTNSTVCFSALQRAENSSILWSAAASGICGRVSVLFSEPKIPQPARPAPQRAAAGCFSALQRAENSSTCVPAVERATLIAFQCSSASRKFLNVLRNQSRVGSEVSVLFSEPKIPQSSNSWRAARSVIGFSALQRAENSSTGFGLQRELILAPFQCSSASRKFLNLHSPSLRKRAVTVSVLFSEPKIPQTAEQTETPPLPTFQCSSASRKFLNGVNIDSLDRQELFQCSSASRKFLKTSASIAA